MDPSLVYKYRKKNQREWDAQGNPYLEKLKTFQITEKQF